jgi:maleylacetoacetate isomerase
MRVLKMVGEEKKAEWAKHWISFGFEGVEKTLSTTAGTYCVGDSITLAGFEFYFNIVNRIDICLVPQVYNANRFGVDMSKFPAISRIAKTLSENPSFVKAHPDSQPDAQTN